MLHFVLLNLIFRVVGFVNGASEEESDVGELISNLRNDANLDLSADEEYEDLRAELLAYHTALASLSNSQTRRSMMSTPCWQMGGICINVELCNGYTFITQVPACKDRFNVCCFAWNKFRVKDFRDKGIGILAMPWSLKQEFGGKGILNADSNESSIKEKNRPKIPEKSGKEKEIQDILEASKTNQTQNKTLLEYDSGSPNVY